MKQTVIHQISKREGYVICSNRRNAPRISVQVCERACLSKDTCEEYRLYMSVRDKQRTLPFALAKQGAACQ